MVRNGSCIGRGASRIRSSASSFEGTSRGVLVLKDCAQKQNHDLF